MRNGILQIILLIGLTGCGQQGSKGGTDSKESITPTRNNGSLYSGNMRSGRYSANRRCDNGEKSYIEVEEDGDIYLYDKCSGETKAIDFNELDGDDERTLFFSNYVFEFEDEYNEDNTILVCSNAEEEHEEFIEVVVESDGIDYWGILYQFFEDDFHEIETELNRVDDNYLSEDFSLALNEDNNEVLAQLEFDGHHHQLHCELELPEEDNEHTE